MAPFLCILLWPSRQALVSHINSLFCGDIGGRMVCVGFGHVSFAGWNSGGIGFGRDEFGFGHGVGFFPHGFTYFTLWSFVELGPGRTILSNHALCGGGDKTQCCISKNNYSDFIDPVGFVLAILV